MNDEATLSFHYEDNLMEMVFPTKIHAATVSRRLQPRAKEYIVSLGKRFGPIMHIVDVGACAGTWAIPFVLWFPEAKILSIEPSKYNYPYLETNCANYPNIKTLKMAASNIRGTVTIAAPTSVQRDRTDLEINTGLISVYGNSDVFRETVDADLLDNLAEQRVDWLKIDVEGHEIPVLEGAKEIVSQHRPLLQVEVRDETQRLAKSRTLSMVNFISAYNYSVIGGIDDDWIFVPQEKMT